jgi:CAAX prenyl protease-like protein
MDSARSGTQHRNLIAYVSPFAVFLALLMLNSGLKRLGGGFWLSSAEYWIFPLQTVVCGGLLLWFRQEIEFHTIAKPLLVLAAGVGVFLLWISPQAFFSAPARTDGFNPQVFAGQPAWYWLTVGFRFLRLVVVVPFLEEIFWRGFLLRYLINDNFDRVRFGSFSWLSFVAVTLGFCFAHSQSDWIAAAITGVIYNGVAYRTKSLLSCVVTHALTNLLLGLWIMRTAQWGFW